MTSQPGTPDPNQPSWNQPEDGPVRWGEPSPPPMGSPYPGWAPTGQPGPAQGQWQPPTRSGAPVAPGSYGATAPKPTNVLAIVALVSSFLLAPLGLILGFVSRQQIRQRGEEGAGLALAAIIVGAVFTLGWICSILAMLGSLGSSSG